MKREVHGLSEPLADRTYCDRAVRRLIDETTTDAGRVTCRKCRDAQRMRPSPVTERAEVSTAGATNSTAPVLPAGCRHVWRIGIDDKAKCVRCPAVNSIDLAMANVQQRLAAAEDLIRWYASPEAREREGFEGADSFGTRARRYLGVG